MIETLPRDRAGYVVVALFAILATIYSLVTPIFEASDEISHYPVIEHIATTRELTVQRVGVKTLWDQEGSQPPLYYMMGAAITFWIDTSDLEAVRELNPHAKLGIPLDPDNKNMILHTDAESLPWRGTVLAVHLVRFVGVALGAISVSLAYALAKTLFPESDRIPWVTASLMAFNPMYLFISGSVNNDNLIVALGTAILLVCARVYRLGLTRRRAIGLAVLCALASVTKISGLTLLAFAGITLFVHGLRTREWRSTVFAGIALAGAWTALAAWWYARNLVLYGELLGIETQVAIAGGRGINLWELLRDEWRGFWISYWGLFGAVNILADQAVYAFYALLTVISAVGLAVWSIEKFRGKEWPVLTPTCLLGLQIVVTLVGLIRWTLTTYASQGRLMFPVIAALSLLMALGLARVIPEKSRGVAIGAIGVPLIAIAALAPFLYIAPTYRPAPIVSMPPADATPVGMEFEGLELVAVKSGFVTAREGDFLPVTLYWRLNRITPQNISIFLHAFGRDYQSIGKIDSYPGTGTWPTTRMKVGDIIKDTYYVELDKGLETPAIVRVLIGAGIWREGHYTFLSGKRPDGSQANGAVVEVGVIYGANLPANCKQPIDTEHQANIGGFATLRYFPILERASPGSALPIRLVWQQTGEPDGDWTVFVHLIDSADQVVAQADGPPANNDYPTRAWKLPCAFEDTHTLDLPSNLAPGEYRVLVGLYDPRQPGYPRAKALALDGAPYFNNAVPIGVIEVDTP